MFVCLPAPPRFPFLGALQIQIQIGSLHTRLDETDEMTNTASLYSAVVVADIVEPLIGGEFNFNGFSNFAELFEIAS